jgi:ElaB/YqjD/DUF883 family membrane-anchored ribosome-binding protein
MIMTTRNEADVIQNGVKNIEERASALKERVIDVKDRAMDRGSAVLEASTKFIRANPVKSVLMAFGAGYILMRLVR